MPIRIICDLAPPTEPGMYLARFFMESCSPLELVQVVDNRGELWLFRGGGNGPLRLYQAKFSAQIEIEVPQ